jgi:hypothetical protein
MAMLLRGWQGDYVMSNKKKTSRFDELIDVARNRVERDKAEVIQDKAARVTKSTDPEFTRTTIYLPKHLHRQLKVFSASLDKQMSDVVIELIEEWLKYRVNHEGTKDAKKLGVNHEGTKDAKKLGVNHEGTKDTKR